MALIFIEGFDAGDHAQKGWTAGGTVSALTRFGTGRSLQLNSNGTIYKRSFTPSASAYIGGAMRSGSSSDPFFHTFTDSGSTQQVYLKSMGTSLGLYSGAGALLAQSAVNTWSDRTWYYLELYSLVADAGGRATVRVNGGTVIDFTGDTRNGAGSTLVDTIGFRGRFAGDDAYFDDVYVCDATGTMNNTFLGDVRVQTLTPTAAGGDTQFTPTGVANNWDNVNELPFSATDYNSSATVGQRDTYVMQDLLATSGTVFGIQNNLIANKTDAGTATLRPIVKSGGTIYYDANANLGTSLATYSRIHETDPATSLAWTPANVNNLESGAEIA